MTADLDQLVDRARGLHVRSDAAAAYVRELDRWARPEARRVWPWFAVAATAAAAVVIAVVMRPAVAPAVVAIEPVHVGDRVAIVAAPGTAYRVVAASDAETRIAVDRGSITARLWHGATPHHLALEGGGVIATATGTVYSLEVTPAGGVVHVDEGTVEVVDPAGVHAVTAGTSLPASSPPPDPHAAARLLELPAPPAPALDAPPPLDAGTPLVDEPAPADAPAPPHVRPIDAGVPDASPMIIKDQWRLARLLRGQGKFAEAIAECEVIADAHDPTWSPIALVEAVRIYLSPLSDPERAIGVADRMLRDWPEHALVGETRALRCQALAQLGRAGECESHPAP